MINWKAAIVGLICTIILILLGQLAFALVVSYIGNIGDKSPFITANKETLWITVGLLTYFGSMLIGGSVTAFLVDEHRVINATFVGMLASCCSLALSLSSSGTLTFMGMLLVLSGGAFAAIGGLGRRWFATSALS